MFGDYWGASPLTNLMEVKDSEAQGRDREVASERSVEQRCEPMDKNRIRGRRRWTSWQMATKSISIKAVDCKSGGCVLKVVELTSGDLPFVVGITTEERVTGPDRAAEVSRGRSNCCGGEGPNGPPQGG
jgi:hypothetical protein